MSIISTHAPVKERLAKLAAAPARRHLSPPAPLKERRTSPPRRSARATNFNSRSCEGATLGVAIKRYLQTFQLTLL